MKKISLLLLTFIALSVIHTNAQVSIGSQEKPHTAAVLDLKSTSKGLLLPNVELDMTNFKRFVLEGSADKASATGLLVFNSIDKNVYFWTGTKWNPLSTNIEEHIDTVHVGELVFMDRNLGADIYENPMPVSYGSERASSLNGGYFQWGRIDDGHQKWNSATVIGAVDVDANGQVSETAAAYGKFIRRGDSMESDWRKVSDSNLWTSEGGTGNPCPEGYRVPTKEEWEKVIELVQWKTALKGLTFGSTFFLPAGGQRSHSTGGFSSEGSYGYYWSSTTLPDNASNYFRFSSSSKDMTYQSRGYGMCLRCIKE